MCGIIYSFVEELKVKYFIVYTNALDQVCFNSHLLLPHPVSSILLFSYTSTLFFFFFEQNWSLLAKNEKLGTFTCNRG